MAKSTFLDFVLSQWATVPPVLTTDLKVKSVVVTGANTGLGLEAAKHFARMNPARLILACRNEQKGLNAATLIATETSYHAEVQVLDLAQFDSVVAFSQRLGNDPIDILVANAGVAQIEYHKTKDGWEESLQVNHLSTALLSFLLLPNLLRATELHEASGPARLVIVSSGVGFRAMIGEDLLSHPSILVKLSDEEYCAPDIMATRYPMSKLLNIFFTRAFFQHLLRSSKVVPTTVSPGYCYSELRRNLPLSQKIRMQLMDVFLGRSTEQGARQLVWAALGPDGKDGLHIQHIMGGAYVSNTAVREPSDYIISKEGYEAQERVWHETIDILSKTVPSVRTIVEAHFSLSG